MRNEKIFILFLSILLLMSIVNSCGTTNRRPANGETATSEAVDEAQADTTGTTAEAVLVSDNQTSGHAVLLELFGEQLVNAAGETVPTTVLAGKKIGLYFSAEWCPPCRVFTPLLVDTYNELQGAGIEFELVFVSSDQSKDHMYTYMNNYDMPWKAVPYEGPYRNNLAAAYSITGIPDLIIIDSQGVILSLNGRGEVQTYGAEAYNLW